MISCAPEMKTPTTVIELDSIHTLKSIGLLSNNTFNYYHTMRFFLIAFLFVQLTACDNKLLDEEAFFNAPQPVVTFSGDTIYPAPMHGTRLEDQFRLAILELNKKDTEENYIWLGRRKAYMNHFHEAITIFTLGLEEYPNSYRLLRHRGHRFISSRQLDRAINDLETASVLMRGYPMQMEPDGIPNKLNQPLSTVQFNVYYHMGLAYYLKGDYENAIRAYSRCLEFSNNDDLLVATTDWYYMTLMRMGRKEEAVNLLRRIGGNMRIVENDSYYQRLKLYKGYIQPDDLLVLDKNSDGYELNIVTQGYGLGNWYLTQGDTAKAVSIFEQILQTPQWAAFGYIAAEADMQKLRK
jgi:tetratricopeptide (TPR) repeat protein